MGNSWLIRWLAAPLTGLSLAGVETVAAAPPTGFIKTPVVTGLSEPTLVAFLPDGRMLIGQRGGRIRMFAGGQLLTTSVLQLQNVALNGDVGLLGLAVDPNF